VLLLLGLPFFFVRRGRGTGSYAEILAALVRATATAALILLLAGIHLERPRPAAGTCLVAAIDVSASVQRAASERAREVLANLLPALGPHDLIGSIAFAARAHVVTHPRSGLQ